MRYDLNILWVEDTATYYEETQKKSWKHMRRIMESH